MSLQQVTFQDLYTIDDDVNIIALYQVFMFNVGGYVCWYNVRCTWACV